MDERRDIVTGNHVVDNNVPEIDTFWADPTTWKILTAVLAAIICILLANTFR